MIFDEDNHPPAGRADEPAPSRRGGRRRRRSSSGGSGRRSGRSQFEDAMRLDPPREAAPETNHVLWLWVLGLLIVAVLGFSWWLHAGGGAPKPVAGAPPSAELGRMIDPLLAPLETGPAGLGAETITALAARFRDEQAAAGQDAREVFGAALAMAGILQEAAADRERHLARLAEVAAVPGDTERKHLEVAVGVSWQRNSGAYRNRLEELWGRLTRLEAGRFRPPAALPLEQTP